jgi:hypothetical protein
MREITYPISLTTAELAYLLATLQAETLLGGDDQALFPRDIATREDQWRRGRAQLEADGWLIWDAVAGHHRLSEALMEIVAALADPEVVVITEWAPAGQPHRGVAHYLSLDLVVEMAMVDGVYQLVVLAAMRTLVERLANALAFPDTRPLEIAFELSRHAIEQAKRDPDPAWLEARGLAAQAAQLFAETLRQPSRYGSVTLLRTRLGKAVMTRLVGLLISASGLGWQITPVDDDHLRYTLADIGYFEALLSSSITDVRDAENHPGIALIE